jgi:hypothetical protein
MLIRRDDLSASSLAQLAAHLQLQGKLRMRVTATQQKYAL